MRKIWLLTLALAMVVGSLYMTFRQRVAVTVSSNVIANNPTDRYTTGTAPAGVVIVAHGFAGNKELMRSWGYTLARQGFDTYVIDQPGHGESLRPLPAWQGAGDDALGQNLVGLIDALVGSGRAQAGRIALVGHSMGGAAVTQAALIDSRVTATVAISSAFYHPLPSQQPRNLLSMVAEADPADMLKAVQAVAVQSDAGRGVLGERYGDFAKGTARESRVVAGRNHLTILYDADVMRRTGDWIHASFGTQPPAGLAVDQPWLWVTGALAGALGVVLATASVLAPASDRGPVSHARTGLLTALVTVAVAALSAVITCAYLRIPWPRLAVVGYVLPYFLVMAAVFFVLRMMWPNDFRFQIADGREPLGSLLRTGGVFLGYLGGFGVVIQMTLSNYVPNAPRLLPMLAVAAGLWLFFVQEEALKRAVSNGRGLWAGLLVGVLSKLIIMATWLGAMALPNPQRILPLIMPVIFLFLMLTELVTFFLARWRYSAMAAATFVALVIAWSVAVTFPLI